MIQIFLQLITVSGDIRIKMYKRQWVGGGWGGGRYGVHPKEFANLLKGQVMYSDNNHSHIYIYIHMDVYIHIY